MLTRGERLRHFAKEHSKTLAAFAEGLGIVPQQLQPYVSGERFPKDDLLEKIAMMGCNLNWLVTGEGSMYADNEAGWALQRKNNDYNKNRDDNIGSVLDGRSVLEQKVYTNVISEEEVNQLESLTKKLRSLL